MGYKSEKIEKFRKLQLEEQKEELNKNSALIQTFIAFALSKEIKLSISNFKYVRAIGIVARYPNIVCLLNQNISKDKEELFDVYILEKEYKKEKIASGFYYSDNYLLMAHPYFRRGYHENSNFAPRFIEIFWNFNKKNIQKYIAIDEDRVRINVDKRIYMEFDTWHGAKFNTRISEITDGIVKLRPPLDLTPFYIEFLFGNTYSLDIKWTSKNGIKVFQAEEFKTENIRIAKSGNEYYPVK